MYKGNNDETSMRDALATDVTKVGAAFFGTRAPAHNPWREERLASPVYAKLALFLVSTDPRGVPEALFGMIDLVCNSYKWAGGVPDPVTGEISDILRRPDYYSFLDGPNAARHIPLNVRVNMGIQYLAVVFETCALDEELLASLTVLIPQLKVPLADIVRARGGSR